MGSYLDLFLKNPVTWTTIFLPIIYSLIYVHTEKNIRDNEIGNDDSKSENGNDDSKIKNSSPSEMIKSEWSHAWNNYNNQVFLVVSSLIFAIIETYRPYSEIYDMKVIWDKDAFLIDVLWGERYSFFLLMMILIISISFFLKVIKGRFSTVQIIENYLPKDSSKYGVSTPRINFPLTQYRISILVYTILLIIWKKECYECLLLTLTFPTG